MTREDFKVFINKTLLELKIYAESHINNKLPDDLEFYWASNTEKIIRGKNNIVEEICEKIYLSEDKIYPCVDLIVEKKTSENLLLLSGHIAGYKPKEFGKGWSDRTGPFIYGISSELLKE
ncbi:hypothetical protein [Tenacibaculum sp. IB213877]|uniref:hypothetical protein n=1 Tax=Tenacibaculum sp. IB213877 TaxID=3097351 RepID=UPI002A5A46A8|nr:hypothetical protein [Tenacibaculum sp. IB213877]MDY0780363.1 hypothetical protein [Tenacibaculum sp. IB213877]